jgi:hypothetical protein
LQPCGECHLSPNEKCDICGRILDCIRAKPRTRKPLDEACADLASHALKDTLCATPEGITELAGELQAICEDFRANLADDDD